MNDAEFIKRVALLAKTCGVELTAGTLEGFDRLIPAHGYGKLCSALDGFISSRLFPSIRDLDAAAAAPNFIPNKTLHDGEIKL